ncbi:hypothetical protein [Amycolatopsis rubida]|uniref:hypothetical protein n=1 Tax=Amycolatopsis TaxID=1813 RepID=UPI000831BE5E
MPVRMPAGERARDDPARIAACLGQRHPIGVRAQLGPHNEFFRHRSGEAEHRLSSPAYRIGPLVGPAHLVG